MANPSEELIGRAYECFMKGDIPGLLALCDDSMTFHVPGSTGVSGSYTKSTFLEMAGKVMQISGGTFGERLVNIVANGERGIAQLDHWLERDGKRIEYRTDHIWDIKDGRFTRWEERPGSMTEFEAAWS